MIGLLFYEITGGGTTVMPTVFFRKCNSNNSGTYKDDAYIFCSYEAIFAQSLRDFQHTFASVE
jgi:hypothetical protein